MMPASTLYEPELHAPAWASAFGQDKYGYFADFSIPTGDQYWECVAQRMRWIPPGTFWMGSPEGEHARGENELRHQVTLSQGYWLAETTCTQELWVAVMGENPSRFQEETGRPVEKVSWDDAQGFFGKINELLPDLQLRLPTEAQWEHACRCMTETPFHFGQDVDPSLANYDGNYPYRENTPKGLYREETLLAKHFSPNPWGLYQMHGNVWEWCSDWYGDYSEAASDPVGPAEGEYRVLRGGSWVSSARYLRSAFRYCYLPDHRNGDVGFRFLSSASAAKHPADGKAESASAS